jgi:hypothetical protein
VQAIQLSEFIENVQSAIAAHRISDAGQFRRWTRQDANGSRDLGVNAYGCADAANLLYSIGKFPRDPSERASWVNALQNLQEPDSGLFREATHHEIHTTAHCIAALELFDALPRYELKALAPLRDPAAMERFLDGLGWTQCPWSESHKGAGLYVSLVLTGAASTEWQERYFDWLWRETDAKTGFLRRGCIGPVKAGNTEPIFPHLAGTFHYLFNCEYARRPLRFPQALIDTCLDIRQRGLFPLGCSIGFADIDWVYCITRALRQSGYRFDDCRNALIGLAQQYADYLLSLDWRTDAGLDDLHMLFGTVCCLAELQQAVPDLIRTERPLKLVLDRRPFI